MEEKTEWEKVTQKRKKHIQTWEIMGIFEKIENNIKEKETCILELQKQIGILEEKLNQSIPLVEYKKTQFLLEEVKQNLHKELEKNKKILEEKEKSLKEYILYTKILVMVGFFMIALLIGTWYMYL